MNMFLVCILGLPWLLLPLLMQVLIGSEIMQNIFIVHMYVAQSQL